MQTLFPLEPPAADLPDIPGLSLRRDYITAAEEAALVAAIDQEPWETSWERRRQPYGVGYGKAGGVVPPIPGWGGELIAHMHREGICERPFDHLLVNEYFPGQGIALHRDYQPFDRTVVSLSLLSACVMDFRHVTTGRRESLLLPPRSLLILSDEARYAWMHGIARRKNDRWRGWVIPRSRRLSVTCRLLKAGRSLPTRS